MAPIYNRIFQGARGCGGRSSRLHCAKSANAFGPGLDIPVYHRHNTPYQEVKIMFDNPVARRTAVAAAIGAVIAIPVPFVGPLIGAVVGGGYGFFSAPRPVRCEGAARRGRPRTGATEG